MGALSFAEVTEAVAKGHDLGAVLDLLDVSQRLHDAHDAIRSAAEDKDGCEALLVTNLLNIRALTGFTGSAAKVLLFADRSVLVTDGRYAERAVDELRNANCGSDVQVEFSVRAQNEFLASELRTYEISRLGLEATHITWAELNTYDEVVDAQLVPMKDLVENLRRTKTVAELQRLARASVIADRAFGEVWAQLGGRPTERGFAAVLEQTMRDMGADGLSFASIIASGPNASRPHHEPGNRTIERGDLVICDFGALVDGYHSDTTRTVCVGAPSTTQQRHLDAVRKTQSAGVDMVAPGIAGVDVDTKCRDVLHGFGWEQYFTTGLGHGSGLQIHEEPFLGRTSTSVLAEGDITTVEPGVYIPGDAGVRIEDSMVVTSNGPVMLTRLPYELVA